jgi:hypothetical protein
MPQQHLPISLWLRFCRWLWKYPLPFLLSTLLVNVAINIGSTWLITPATTKAIPDTSSLGNIAGWISVHWAFSLFLGMISIALLFVTWLGSRKSESASSAPTQIQLSARDRERMIKRLRVRYEQLLAQSLQGAVEIELGLTSRPAAIQNAMSLSLRLPEQPEQALPAHTSILDAYHLAQQELLILGEPGAGKSMGLLKLAQHLVEQAEQDRAQLLPVVLPLSSWATKRLSLQDWLIEQFALLYDIPRQLSHDWIQAGLILPLLDGLDEMEESARPACIVAINAYHREHLQPLVVCSRTAEHDTATLHERLALHTAIVVQPLTLAQIDAHLTTIGKPLTALRTTLNKNTTLQTLATTPLLLQILMLTYHDIPVWGLSHKENQLQEQIWSDYVQRMVNRKGNNQYYYPLEQTRAWLGWLAQQMRSQNITIFSLEQLPLNWLPKGQRMLYQWNIGLLVGLLVGPLVGLLVGLLVGPFIGLLVGPFIGLLVGLLVGLDTEIEPTEAVIWSWERLLFGLLVGPFIGLLVGLFVGLLSGLLVGLGSGLLVVLFVVLFFGLGSGLSDKQLTERHMLSPNEGIRRSMKNGLFVGLLFGLGGGLLVGLFVGLLFGLLVGLESGLLFGLLVGLESGLGGGLQATLQHYLLRFWLWRSHLFPWKAVPFLEDATARNLLRRVGGRYSFTHRLLLDYFADLETPPLAPSSNPHPASPPSVP